MRLPGLSTAKDEKVKMPRSYSTSLEEENLLNLGFRGNRNVGVGIIDMVLCCDGLVGSLLACCPVVAI